MASKNSDHRALKLSKQIFQFQNHAYAILLYSDSFLFDKIALENILPIVIKEPF